MDQGDLGIVLAIVGIAATIALGIPALSQDQPMLLAPDLRDWLAADHPARWVDDLVEHGLDLSAIYADYTEVRGAPPYEPRLMSKILIYGYSHGGHVLAGVGAALP